MATAEFSKFAGILSAMLSQHHLSEFKIAQLEGSSPHFIDCKHRRPEGKSLPSSHPALGNKVEV